MFPYCYYLYQIFFIKKMVQDLMYEDWVVANENEIIKNISEWWNGEEEMVDIGKKL